MLSPLTRRFLAALMLLVFSIFITPKELMHAFTHHTDTQHEACDNSGVLHFSTPHHHCELLKVDQQFSAFAMTFQSPHFQPEMPVYTVFLLHPFNSARPQHFITGHSLRGPPMPMI